MTVAPSGRGMAKEWIKEIIRQSSDDVRSTLQYSRRCV